MLAARDSDVALTYHRNATAAAGVVNAIELHGRHGEAASLTLEDEAAVAAYLDGIIATHGSIHTLVYAAGPHVPMIHLSRVSPAEFRRQIDHDVIAFFNLVHAALPHLRAAAGNVVAVTTVATRRYPVRDGLSAAPKGAVEALVRGLAAEEGRFGVRLNCVGPGMMVDGMAERLISSGELDERALDVARNNIPMRAFGTAADIAEAVCFLASDRARYITGLMLDVDGGYHL
jgi:NAD(P)-dependent dehydrogenase (short-subunit alcohol dehydrogenase family)